MTMKLDGALVLTHLLTYNLRIQVQKLIVNRWLYASLVFQNFPLFSIFYFISYNHFAYCKGNLRMRDQDMTPTIYCLFNQVFENLTVVGMVLIC